MIEGSENGASLSMGALRGEPGGMAPFNDKTESYVRHVKKGFGVGASLSF
jgi:hypothetical protein